MSPSTLRIKSKVSCSVKQTWLVISKMDREIIMKEEEIESPDSIHLLPRSPQTQSEEDIVPLLQDADINQLPSISHDSEIQDDTDDDAEAAEVKRKLRETTTGLACMAASALMFSMMSLMVHIGSETFPSLEMVVARSLVQLVISSVYLLLTGTNPLGPSEPRLLRPLLLLRGLAGSIGLALFFYTLTVLSLADGTVLFFTGPVFTIILAHLVMGEALEIFDILASLLCLAGVVLVARPQFLFPADHDPSNPVHSNDGDPLQKTMGVIAALSGAITTAVAYVTVRKITQISTGLHTMVIVFYFGLVSSVLSPIGLLLIQRDQIVAPDSLYKVSLLLGVGTVASIGQVFLNRGLQLAPAGVGTIMRNLDIVFAFLLDTLVLHKHLRWTSFAGAALILTCTVTIGIRKWWQSR
eukprot:Partr_v1_DN25506_c0_g1_i2_m20491 putative solute carrier family 35 member G1